MAASASSQHRCVFVGNIPYDATEEQLIQICEEVGPVVSFRLVLDRETGKPKGYGFCEYKDEETALSARRNLQRYEINGRQLRVDFAENDKNADRNREQGRGGPGMTSSINAQKQLGGPSILGDLSLHQPMGLRLAATASSLMAGALGRAQTSGIQNGLQSQSGMGNDLLTHYLARMSRHQLNEIMSEIKALATQNKALALQLLQGSPQLPKALFQAQIMLGMVTPQMMQMTNSQQSSILASQPSADLGQTPSQKDALVGMLFMPSESRIPNVPQNPTILQQSALPLSGVPVQHQYQLPLPPQAQVLHQGVISGKPGTTVASSIRPPSLSGPSAHPSPPLPASKGLIPQIQPPLQQQHPRPTGAAPLAKPPRLALPNTSLQQSLLPHPPISQVGSSNYQLPLGGLEMLSKEAGTSASVSHDPTWESRTGTQSLGVGLMEQTGMAGDISELMRHPSKIRRLEDGSGAPQSITYSTSNKPISAQTMGTDSGSVSQMTGVDGVQHSEKQLSQLTPEVESALLQQVLSLTPEQLSSLPVEQQQQVLQLQQMLSISK